MLKFSSSLNKCFKSQSGLDQLDQISLDPSVSVFSGDFVHTLGDAHVYSNHVEALKTQLEREPKTFPKIVIKREVEKIEDFNIDDFEIVGYDPHPKIAMDMAV